MDWRENFSRLGANLAQLGYRRLAVLAVAGVLMIVAVAFSGYMLTRPSFEVLYTGLSPRDVSAMGAALGEARIRYDVSEDGKTVKVAYGEAARARMLLAEKGLPRSARAGYELFDNIGALGLTSFMQEVTLIRALEGELARTIQSISGVKAARVHIVLPKKNSFRRASRQPSASVLIRTDSAYSPSSADSIRYLVAGSVPGLSVGRVNVLNTDGTLLASGDDRKSAAPRRLVDLEMTVSRHIQDNVRSTLMPYLGAGNFQVSVVARLNTDKKQVSETVYDPASRVERSIRDIKEKTSSTNTSKSAATSVDQEIPENETSSGPASKNKESRERKERLTNYEISSRKINTISDGYDIARLSVAVVVNRKSLELVLGRKLSDEELKKQEDEIAGLVRTAAGINSARGDQLKITSVEFIQSKSPLQPVPGPGIAEYAMKMVPAAINSLALLAVTGIVIWFGVRPAVNALTASPQAAEEKLAEGDGQLQPPPSAPQLQGPEGTAVAQAGAPTDGEGAPENLEAAGEHGDDDNLIVDLVDSRSQLPLKRLRQMVEYDEKQAAAVIREWLREESAA